MPMTNQDARRNRLRIQHCIGRRRGECIDRYHCSHRRKLHAINNHDAKSRLNDVPGTQLMPFGPLKPSRQAQVKGAAQNEWFPTHAKPQS